MYGISILGGLEDVYVESALTLEVQPWSDVQERSAYIGT